MNKDGLKNAIYAHLKGFWGGGEPASNPDGDDYWLKMLAQAIAYEVIDHITANAKCNGLDSGGDTHANVGIV